MNLKHLVKTIEENSVAIASATKEGKPNIAVAAFVKVKEGQIIVTDNYMKKTIDNIKENPLVSIAVWKDFKGYKIDGKAEYHTSGEWIDFIKSIPENNKLPCKGVIVITPLDTKEIG